MSSTYPENSFTDPVIAPSMTTQREEVGFVPSYARKPTRQKKVKSWMILAPIGAVVLLGGGAVMLMNSGNEVSPLVEPAPAPVVQPLTPTPTFDPLTTALTPVVPVEVAVAEPAPVVRQVAPVRRAAAPVARRAAPPPAPAPRIETPAEPTGPRAYSASPSVAATPAPTTAPVAPPAPAIVTQPLN